MLDIFINPKIVTKSHVPTTNAPIKIDIPIRQSIVVNGPKVCMKHGRHISSKDKKPRKGKATKNQDS